MPLRRYVVFFLIAGLGFAADVATKSWVFARVGMPGEGRIHVLGDVLTLETNLNEGALFGIGQGGSAWFASLSVAASLFILYWLFWMGAARDWLLTVALGCVSAGISGNLYDRLGLPGLRWHMPGDRLDEPVYAVRDWIHFQVEGVIDWPLFNLADSLLVSGACLLVLHAFRQEAPHATKTSTPN